MIPKKIHYCWFGGKEKSKKTEQCIASWKKYCPDYEIIEWNESNFDIMQYDYLKWCHDNKKWAFLSDLARLLIIYQEGGIYYDTDVELIKKPDQLLKNEAFYGFENEQNIATGLGFGACMNHPSLLAMIRQYENLKPDIHGDYTCVKCPQLNTAALLDYGLILNGKMQDCGGAIILPVEFFNPYDDPTGRLNITANTISIHWYGKSWIDKKTILKSNLTRPFHRIFGTECFRWAKKL